MNSRGGIKLVSSDKYATADAGFGNSMIEKPREKRIDNFRPGRSRRHGQEEICGVTTTGLAGIGTSSDDLSGAYRQRGGLTE